jgi:hypothetical protein
LKYLCIFLVFRIFANRTLFVTLSYTIDVIDSENAAREDFPFEPFFALLHYLEDCCPNLKEMTVYFQLQGEFSDEDFRVLSNWLNNTFKEFMAAGDLSSIGLSCDLLISFRAFFPESTLMVIQLIKYYKNYFRRQVKWNTNYQKWVNKSNWMEQIFPQI